jgi:hypothetical protein
MPGWIRDRQATSGKWPPVGLSPQAKGQAGVKAPGGCIEAEGAMSPVGPDQAQRALLIIQHLVWCRIGVGGKEPRSLWVF